MIYECSGILGALRCFEVAGKSFLAVGTFTKATGLDLRTTTSDVDLTITTDSVAEMSMVKTKALSLVVLFLQADFPTA